MRTADVSCEIVCVPEERVCSCALVRMPKISAREIENSAETSSGNRKVYPESSVHLYRRTPHWNRNIDSLLGGIAKFYEGLVI